MRNRKKTHRAPKSVKYCHDINKSYRLNKHLVQSVKSPNIFGIKNFVTSLSLFNQQNKCKQTGKQTKVLENKYFRTLVFHK